MRGMLLSSVLMIIAALMMGCTDSIIPCTDDVDCEMDWGWGDRDADWGGGDWDWGDWGMVCNMDVTPLEKCERLMDFIPPLDWLPFGDWINIPDCEELFGGLPADTGTCESSMSFFLPF